MNLQPAQKDEGVTPSWALDGSRGTLAVGCGIQLSRAVYSSCVLELLNLHLKKEKNETPTQTTFVVLVRRRNGEGKVFSVAVLP